MNILLTHVHIDSQSPMLILTYVEIPSDGNKEHIRRIKWEDIG